MIGALARYAISESVNSQWLAVFLVNQLGVLLAGLVIFKLNSSENQKLFWVAGFSGGFTTFSSFAVLNMKGNPLSNLLISIASFILSLAIIRLIGRVKRV